MKAINIGTTYDIYRDNVKTYDKLPAKNYIVRFNKMSGFYLEEYSDIEIKEKIYGVHEAKVDKVLKSFCKFEKNLGVILSGDKGIGKSLFAKRLAIKAVSSGIPVIIVDKFIPGIASYIEEIDQEVMVLFDEFDKTFTGINTSDNEADPQAGLLSLFDGISQGKKLFVITCNSINKLNDFLINRPGRFHYHFRFGYPTVEELKEYLEDKLEERYYCEIDKVIDFSRKVDLNYDCLRSIAFEINNGETFDKAITDLNIVRVSSPKYDVTLFCTDGYKFTNKSIAIDLFNVAESETIWLYDHLGNCVVGVKFNAVDCKFDFDMCANTVKGDDIEILYDTDEYCPKDAIEKAKEHKPKCLVINRSRSKSLHYTV